MWTVVYVADSIEAANKITKILRDEGFLVKTELIINDGEEIYEILAPEIEAEEIKEFIIELNIY